MSKKEEFYKWWLENGSLSRDPAMNEFKRQNKPIEGIGTSEIRLYVKEFKAGLEEISNIEYKKSDIKKEVKPLLELLRKEQTLDNLIKAISSILRLICTRRLALMRSRLFLVPLCFYQQLPLVAFDLLVA